MGSGGVNGKGKLFRARDLGHRTQALLAPHPCVPLLQPPALEFVRLPLNRIEHGSC